MTFTEFLASWGWVILTLLFIWALVGIKHKGTVVLIGLLAAAALGMTAGFNPPLPHVLWIDNVFAFFVSIIAFFFGMLVGWGGLFVFVVLLFCLFPTVDQERESWSFLLLIASAVMLYIATGFNLFMAPFQHPIWTAIAAVGYVIGGIAWGIGWWHLFIDKGGDAFEEAQRRFIGTWREKFETDAARGSGLSSSLSWIGMNVTKHKEEDTEPLRKRMLEDLVSGKIPDELVEQWHRDNQVVAKKPSVFENKERILNRMMFWPWSLLSYFLRDFFRELWAKIWKHLRAVFQAVVDRKYAKFDQRLIKKPAFE